MNYSHGIVPPGDLTRQNATHYRKYGYLVAPGLLGAEEIAALKKETADIFRGDRGHVDGLLEVGGLPDQEVLKKYVAIHFPHKLSPLIKRYLSHPAIVDILQELVSPNLKC